ncbi:MAG: hypothetical protein U0Z26_09735 [Anaerolineales bacterium]
MINASFMLQDLIGTLLGFLIFPLVLVIPGYLAGTTFDLFNFNRRFLPSRLVISLLLSVAISPILYYLLISYFSFNFALIATVSFALYFMCLLFKQRSQLLQNQEWRSFIFVALVWIVVAVFLLIDLQWGEHELYFNVASFDHTTRVSIIDAMSRTGVPPINPSYYPGHYEKLTFLYFFWYILGSIIDVIGGKFVDARAALFASIIWCGLALMAVIAFYLRLRNGRGDGKIWKQVMIGFASLLITGLDIFPALLLIGYGHSVFGDLEQWNEQITAWLGSLLWVPHHVAGFIAGFVGVALVHSVRGLSKKKQIVSLLFAGIAFASAIGLSVWVTLVFVIFWGLWMLITFVEREHRELLFPMVLAGVFAVLLSGSFLLGLAASNRGGDSGGTTLPITFTVRAFHFADAFMENTPNLIVQLVHLILLPVNYFFELGFFLFVGWIWIRRNISEIRKNPFYSAEVILLAVSFFLATFTRSTVIDNNDLGWRAWLPGQFILLIWGVDILPELAKFGSRRFSLSASMKYNLVLLVALGVSTTVLDAVLLRFGYYLTYGENAGHRIYSSRMAYSTINNTLPQDVIIQNNPIPGVDRPIGLYGMRQSVISARTAYGIPMGIYNNMVATVGAIFSMKDVQNWEKIDLLCKSNFIDELVISDEDALWASVPLLLQQRTPVYADDYYAVFSCSNK